MKTNTIITIGREFGSAGREIGYKVAKEFGIKLYDKEMLARAAKESGICEEIFESHDEKPTSSFLYSLVMDTYSMGYSGNTYTDMPINHKIFLAQFDTIKKMADEGPCVIIGRCADYALEDYPNVVSVFITGDEADKIKRISELYDVDEAKAKDLMVKTDKRRSSYYNYYSNKKWGDPKSYDMCINSSAVGQEGAVDIIMELAKKKQEWKKQK